MTHARRIRAFLLIVALLPPLMILLFLYVRQGNVVRQQARLSADKGLKSYLEYQKETYYDLRITAARLASSNLIRETLVRINSSQTRYQQFSITPQIAGRIAFAEIIDSTDKVIASWTRPGMIGQKPNYALLSQASEMPPIIERVEYDIEGGHAAFHLVTIINPNYRLLTGRHIGTDYIRNSERAGGAVLKLFLPGDTAQFDDRVGRMHARTVYEIDDSYQSLFAGGRDEGFYLLATFEQPLTGNLISSLLPVTAVVALVSVIIALSLGLYAAGRTRREIDNLVHATSRVANGDLSTPVMAYEEGEFSELADSFSNMMQQLNDSQSRLAASQKIAAWQVMGRKVAHEIKNPLTPISISIDDIRRSYDEKLPDFSKTLHQGTDMVKREIRRLSHLLDHFVQFARMTPPQITDVNLSQLVSHMSQLYATEIKNGTLSIINNCTFFKVKIDMGQISQLLLNLIKNGLESSQQSAVTVHMSDANPGIKILVSDNGPGFSDEYLAASFEPYISSKHDGSGLGLVICQRIAVDHGGKIAAFNQNGKGGVVEVTLPDVG